MIAEIEGTRIQTEADFHREVANALGFGSYYGMNLDALWDVLTCDVERPATLVWKNSEVSKKSMPVEFKKIIELLRDVEKQDAEFSALERFELRLQ